jgi:Mn-dependent DtxR family transcriptional regulator
MKSPPATARIFAASRQVLAQASKVIVGPGLLLDSKLQMSGYVQSDSRAEKAMLTNKRTIPEIRLRLRELADIHGIDELHDLADETYRRSPFKRARNKSATLTPALAERIRRFVRDHPQMHQRDVAQKFNVNPGRVSESLNNLM